MSWTTCKIMCKLQVDNHASTLLLNFFTGRLLFLMPNQQCQSTESKIRTTTIDTLIIILTDSEIIGMKSILFNETTLADRESQITENWPRGSVVNLSQISQTLPVDCSCWGQLSTRQTCTQFYVKPDFLCCITHGQLWSTRGVYIHNVLIATFHVKQS